MTSNSYHNLAKSEPNLQDMTSNFMVKQNTSIPKHILHDNSQDLPIVEIDEKIKKYLKKCDDGSYGCSICGKSGSKKIYLMKAHIETHIDGFSLNCKQCGRQFKNRNSLGVHKSMTHRIINAPVYAEIDLSKI